MLGLKAQVIKSGALNWGFSVLAVLKHIHKMKNPNLVVNVLKHCAGIFLER
jgi:hypothetical protein